MLKSVLVNLFDPCYPYFVKLSTGCCSGVCSAGIKYLIVFCLLVPGNTFSQTADTTLCRTFLENNYNNNTYANYDTSGCKYAGASVTKLSTPYLNKYMPGYSFFKTELQSGYENYPIVPTIVVYNEKKPEASYVMYASTFKKPKAAFFKVFNNLQVPDTTERRLLATDIAGLQVPIHKEAVAKELVCNKYPFTVAFELWEQGSSLRVVNVRFTNTHKLQLVDMINGTAGGDVRNGYVRKE